MTPGAPGSYSGTDSSGKKQSFSLDSNGNYTGYDDCGKRTTLKPNSYGGSTWHEVPRQTPSYSAPSPSPSYTYPTYSPRPQPVQSSYTPPSYSSSSPSPYYSTYREQHGRGFLKTVILGTVLALGAKWALHHQSEIADFVSSRAAQSAGQSAPAVPEPQEASSKVDFPEPGEVIDQKLARLNKIMHGRTPSPLPTSQEVEMAALYKQEAQENDTIAIDDGFAACKLTPKDRALCVPVDQSGNATGKEAFVISHADLRRARYLTVESDWEDRHAQQAP